MGLAHIHRTHTHKHRIHTHTHNPVTCARTHTHTHRHCTHGRVDANVSRQGQRRTPHTHTPCTHAMELESCQNPTHTKTCFTHAQRFTNTKHHSQTYAFCFRNKYIMFYTYKETYFFNYKKIKVQTIFYKYGTLKVARGSEGICAWISNAEK